MLVERHSIGLYFENSSELSVQDINIIGCGYGYVLDNRFNRIAAHSVLNVASVDNDVSSNSFLMCTSYFAQHTGILLLNSGGNTFQDGTHGIFSENPSLSPGLGFPTASAGIHVCGTSNNSNWTRSDRFEGLVFEPTPSTTASCILLDSSTVNEPIIGVTVDTCHVQTFAANHAGGVVTTFIEANETAPGDIQNVHVINSGFTFQSSGFFYGNMAKLTGTPAVVFDKCYPEAAFATSVLTSSVYVRDEVLLEKASLAVFPPSGWTASGVTTGVSVEGGSAGVPASIKFDGDTGAITINKNFVYREDVDDIGYVFISFMARGDADLVLTAEVNGVIQTLSSTKSGDNNGRYSNAIFDQNVTSSTNYRLMYFCFRPFSANTPFNQCRWTLGKAASASSSEFIEVRNLKVGYLRGGSSPYNPFV